MYLKVALLVSVVYCLSVAIGCRERHKHVHANPFKILVHHVDLRDTQKNKIHAVAKKYKAMKKAMYSKTKKNWHNTLAQEIKKENINKVTLSGLMVAKHEAKKQLYNFLVEQLVEVHGMLDSKQRRQWAQLLEQHHSKSSCCSKHK